MLRVVVCLIMSDAGTAGNDLLGSAYVITGMPVLGNRPFEMFDGPDSKLICLDAARVTEPRQSIYMLNRFSPAPVASTKPDGASLVLRADLKSDNIGLEIKKVEKIKLKVVLRYLVGKKSKLQSTRGLITVTLSRPFGFLLASERFADTGLSRGRDHERCEDRAWRLHTCRR